MPRLKKIDLFPGYARVREPDKEKLAELVHKAKGENRTLSEFAEACGVNTSSLSRIINRKNAGASADSVIVAIALNADPESRVTIDELIAAHGLSPKPGERVRSPKELLAMLARDAHSAQGDIDRMKKASKCLPLRDREIVDACREAVVNALLLKGFSITLGKECDIMDGAEFPYAADFVLETDALKEEGLDRWAFSWMKRTGAALVFEPTSAFGCAFMDNPAERGIKLTFLTDDETGFQYFKEAYSDKRIPASMSLMLIDRRKKHVKAEFIIPRKDSMTEPVMLFDEGSPDFDWVAYYGMPDDIDGGKR